MKIYSEELAALQEELKIAHAQYKAFPENERFKNIYEAAVHKLKLFGLTPLKSIQWKQEAKIHHL